MKPLSEIHGKLKAPARILITMHQKPDADAMGAALALSQLLKKLGHLTQVISPTNWAAWLNWMPGTKHVLDFESQGEKCKKEIEKAEWIFCLDFNRLDRLKKMAPDVEHANAIKILIDHHQQPQEEAFDYGCSDISKSSTCEMIFDFILDSGNKELIDLEIAECLYAGLMADTGSFRFPAASDAVHHVVAELKKMGLEHTKIHENIYDNFNEGRLRFIGHVLTHRMEVFYEYNTALIAIPKGDLLRFAIRTGDTEGLVNFPLSIKGIKLAALVIDRDEERKWSFRSKGDFDVNSFAREHFNGGGHFNASGGRSQDSLGETIKKFKSVLKQYQKQLQ